MMTKKWILVCSIFATFIANTFAQTSFLDSARSMATAGMFAGDVDDVNARDISSIESTFFSVVYQPKLLDSDDNNSIGTMNAFWALPFRYNMTVAFAGQYTMNSTKNESFGVGDNSTISTGQTLNEDSSFNLRPVFRYYNMGFHYRISRTGSFTNTTLKETIVPSGDVLTDSDVQTDASRWEHEIGFSYEDKKQAFSLYVPVGVVIDMNTTTTKSTNDDGTTLTQTISTTRNNDNVGTVSLYINPEFVLPLEVGPMTHIKMGLNSSFGVYSTGSGFESSITETDGSTTTKTSIVAEATEQVGVALGLYATPSFSWKPLEDKIDLALDTTVGIKYAHYNPGILTTTTKATTTTIVEESAVHTYWNTITPYINANFGSVVRPLKWLEVRAGISYGLEWENSIETISYADLGGSSVDTASYRFVSDFDIYGGLGFNFWEKFFIDVYIQAGEGEHIVGVANSSGSFEISSYGFQLSYRF